MRAASGRRTLPLPVQPAFVIILLVATVHLIRGALVDALVFVLVAAALLIEQVWLRRHVDRRLASGAAGLRRPRTEFLAVLAIAVAFGWAAGRWELYDWRLKVATGIPGVLVALLMLTHRPPDEGTAPGRPARLWWLWAVVAVGICVQELVSFAQQPTPTTGSHEHPTLSFLIEPLLASPLVRGCLLAGWLAGGYYLLRRAGLLGRAR